MPAITTFQAVVMALVFGISHVFPLGGPTHTVLIPWFFGWQPFPPAFQGVLEITIGLALLIALRHEWASQLASLIRIVAYRRKPMTMDERLPLFLLLACAPVVLTEHWIEAAWGNWGATPFQILGYKAVFSAACAWGLVFASRWSRKKWNLFDWNPWHGIAVGMLLLLSPVTGFDIMSVGLIAAFLLNHKHESAIKFILCAATPWFFVHGLRLTADLPWQEAGQAAGMTGLSFWVAIVVCFGSASLSIVSLQKMMLLQPGFKRFALFRMVVLAAFLGASWLQTT